MQIKLVPVHTPYFDQANLLIAADCTAYAYGNFHARFIGTTSLSSAAPSWTRRLCRKADGNSLRQRYQKPDHRPMEVPCCGGIENAAKQALKNSGKFIPGKW